MLYLLLFLCCATKAIHRQNEVIKFNSDDCVAVLKKNMSKSKCGVLKYRIVSNYDIYLMCHKNDEDRENFWDSNVFRISYIYLNHPTESLERIEKHTICKDASWRLESYPIGY